MISAVKIQDLKPGVKAMITSLVGSESDVARLSAMGIRGGASIQLLRQGSPCIVQVEQSRLCLRPNKQTQILVQPD
ncbi:MAG: FeoA family protein [Pirellulaceae bacterium]